MTKIKFIVLLIIFFISCREEKALTENENDVQSFQTYISKTNEKHLSKNLIACAAGGTTGSLDSASHPISIIFLPITDSYDFKYFEMKNDFFPKEDFNNYFERKAEPLPLLNGFLKRFVLTESQKEYWCRVTYLAKDSLHYCNAIRIKYRSKPTIIANTLVNISYPKPLHPLFNWAADSDGDNFIYFQVVASEKDSVISATYTYEKHFQFYDLSNVVLNVHNVESSPKLKPSTKYKFMLMGVSEDNWVNLFAEVSFRTPSK
ncbi:MAG: hypothetical protein V3V16_15045 [Melioribacteraceae bacterium]